MNSYDTCQSCKCKTAEHLDQTKALTLLCASYLLNRLCSAETLLSFSLTCSLISPIFIYANNEILRALFFTGIRSFALWSAPLESISSGNDGHSTFKCFMHF